MDTQMTQDELYWKNRPLDDAKRDWDYKESNWILDYAESENHSHRAYIVRALLGINFDSLLEIGCNAGPNLSFIGKYFFDKKLAGFDTNEHAVSQAKTLVPKAGISVGSLHDMQYPDKSFDVILSDAVLIYVPPEKIQQVMTDINRIAKKAVILVEWGSKNYLGLVRDFHWARNYSYWFEQYGFKITKTKITKDIWDSKNWIKHGYIWIATR